MSAVQASDSYFELRSQLLGPYRMNVLTPAELANAGRLIYGDADRFSLYGIPAGRMEERGVRVLGRTVIECAIDAYIVPVALAVADLWSVSDPDAVVFDLFCGSGNVGYQLQRQLGCRAYASELDPRVYEVARSNFDHLGAAVRLEQCDYRDLIGAVSGTSDNDVYVLEPPWGPAFTAEGLNLTRTSPPIREILRDIAKSRHDRPCLVVIKTNDQLVGDCLADSFRGATRLRSVTPAPTLPFGANMDFHIYRVAAVD
jgi:predicted RNA methylase